MGPPHIPASTTPPSRRRASSTPAASLARWIREEREERGKGEEEGRKERKKGEKRGCVELTKFWNLLSTAKFSIGKRHRWLWWEKNKEMVWLNEQYQLWRTVVELDIKEHSIFWTFLRTKPKCFSLNIDPKYILGYWNHILGYIIYILMCLLSFKSTLSEF